MSTQDGTAIRYVAVEPSGRMVTGRTAYGSLNEPYAGNVVITGWDDSATWRDEIEIVSLTDEQHRTVTELVSALWQVLGMDVDSPQGFDVKPSWAAAVQEFAAFVTAAPTPSLVFIDEPAEVEAYLRGMGMVAES